MNWVEKLGLAGIILSSAGIAHYGQPIFLIPFIMASIGFAFGGKK